MQIWPTAAPADNTHWLYISLSTVTTCLFGYLWMPIIGFLCAAFWAMFVFWNLVLGPMLVKNWDEDEIPEDKKMDAQVARFFSGENEKVRKELDALRKEVRKLSTRGKSLSELSDEHNR